MNVAKVIFPITLDKEFDYYIGDMPAAVGRRVLVNFCGRMRVGIVTALTAEPAVSRVKHILACLDTAPVITSAHVACARALAQYYPYPAAEFLFMMLPPAFRTTKSFTVPVCAAAEPLTGQPAFFAGGAGFMQRYAQYKPLIQKSLQDGSVVLCFGQYAQMEQALPQLNDDFSVRIAVCRQRDAGLAEVWRGSRQNRLLVGTRSALFYFPPDVRLIVIEDETSPSYFQEEKPYYHAVDVAWVLRATLGVGLVLSAAYPMPETMARIDSSEIQFLQAPQETSCRVQTIDAGQFNDKKFLNPLLIELLRRALSAGKRAVVFFNRKEYSAVIICAQCQAALRCPRCSSFLRWSLRKNQSVCPYCHGGFAASLACPSCHGGPLRYVGIGIDRAAAIIRKMFPRVSIAHYADNPHAQVVLASAAGITALAAHEKFDTGFILDADSFLARPDFNSTVHVFMYMTSAAAVCRDMLYVCTHNPRYYVFQYTGSRWREFYAHELRLRKESLYPPFGALARIIARSRNENKLSSYMEALYNNFVRAGISVSPVMQEVPYKLRGCLRQVLIARDCRRDKLTQTVADAVARSRTSGIKTAVVMR